jgi:hypothetical protein
MRARRVTDHSDAVRVEAEIVGISAHELYGGPAIADHPGPGLHTRFHQPVFDGEDRIAVLGEKATPVPIEFAVADLPPAPVNADQHGRFA